MLFVFLLNIIFVVSCEEKHVKPYLVLPVPLEFPNRNDRSDQCWLRIEDIEIIETITIDCDVAQTYMHNFIRNYNARKIIEDKADIVPWNDENQPSESNLISLVHKKQNAMKDWKSVTLMDPTTNHRLYVTKDAECKLIMYSREGMTNYKVECENILYFINSRMNSRATSNKFNVMMIILFSLWLRQ